MHYEVKVPGLGLAIEEVIVGKWLKEEGEHVNKDEIIATATTDKVTIDLTSPVEGYLIKKYYNEFDTVKIDSVVALISTEEESVEPGDGCGQQDINQQIVSKQQPIKVSPLARRLAEQNAIDLQDVAGTGPNGTITKDDISKYLDNRKESQPKELIAPAAGSVLGQVVGESIPAESYSAPSQNEIEIIPYRGIRRAIGDNMVNSVHTAPHVTTLVEIDMTEVSLLKEKLILTGAIDNLSLLTFIVKAAVKGIKAYPILNSSLVGENIEIKKFVNMGIAVASKEGLVVPVIKDAQSKNFIALAAEIHDLTLKARENKISPETFKNGTLTISNAGTFGALIATPIINQPQSAVLWTGAITKKPVVIDDEIKIRRMMYMTLSYDHRVMDGSTAAKFLVKIKEMLENPLGLLV